MRKFSKFALVFLPLFGFANVLQDAINNASPGDVIKLGDAVYEGGITINKPLSIIGVGKNAHIKGSGKGSVIKIIASNVTLKNLKISGSGNDLGELDAGIGCDKANNVEISKNDISDVLFGIDFKECSSSKITENNITSKKGASLGFRGDAVRLWYSHENLIERNNIRDSRDMVAWYASHNKFLSNKAVGSRYSLHFMYANQNLVENNEFIGNAVGMFFMYSASSNIKNNLVMDSDGAFGIGIGLKDVSDFTIENNTLVYNARGILLDNSPFQPGSTINFIGNKILHNVVGVYFHATQGTSIFENNDFIGNMDIVVNDTPGEKMLLNRWSKNYYDEYESFDRDKDGYGDTPFLHLSYIDQLWQYYPNLQFFYGSSVFSVLNFLAKLAPFSEPIKLLEDSSPRIKPLDVSNFNALKAKRG